MVLGLDNDRGWNGFVSYGFVNPLDMAESLDKHARTVRRVVDRAARDSGITKRSRG